MNLIDTIIKRLPSVYNTNEGSDIYKLFQIITEEINELKRAIEQIQAYRDIDSAKEVTLDKAGLNIGELRGDKNDIDYRKFIKTRIRSNLSKGDIETLNEISSFLIGDAFIGIKETWNQVNYNNEKAAIVIQNKGLETLIKNEYEDYLNELTFLDGSFLLDNSRVLNGGLMFDYVATQEERNDTIQAIKDSIKRITAAGIRIYYEIPESITNTIMILQNVKNKQVNNSTNDISITHSTTSILNNLVATSANNRLDGIHNLNGLTLLDGKRDFAVHDVTIMEVSA